MKSGLSWPEKELVLPTVKPGAKTEVTFLGRPGALKWSEAAGGIKIDRPALSVDQLPCRNAYVFKVEGVE